MVTLCALWLPILVSAAIVFAASAVAWMVLPHHKADFGKLPDEVRFLEALRELKIGPGQYLFPCCSPKDMQDPELKQRWEAGPHGVLRVLRRKPSFGRNLLLVFLFYVVVGFFTSYICIVAGLPRGASYGTVFRLAGTAAIACYILGGIPNAVFMGRSARSVLMDTIDGIVFGLLTAGVFGWLWPR